MYVLRTYVRYRTNQAHDIVQGEGIHRKGDGSQLKHDHVEGAVSIIVCKLSRFIPLI